MDVAPAIDPNVAFERLHLDDASWIDIALGWLIGADALYAHLGSSVEWRQGRVWRYERYIDEPRLGGSGLPLHPSPPAPRGAGEKIQAQKHVHLGGLASRENLYPRPSM